MKDAINVLRDSIHVMEDFEPRMYSSAEPPLVSIYVPVQHHDRTERRNEWTADQFKDLMLEAERTLKEKYPDAKTWEGIHDRMEYIMSHADAPLWMNARQGLAFLINNKEAFVFNLDFEVKPTVMVGTEYYLKPLLRNREHLMHYYLLALSTDRFGWIDGTQDRIQRVALPDDVKGYFAELFADFDGEKSALDYYSLENHEPPYHDFKSRKEVSKEEAEKFFRYVNKAVDDKLAKDDDTPIILVTLPEHATMFRRISTLRHLLPVVIEKNPDQLSGEELLNDAKGIMADRRSSEIAKLVDKFNYDKSKGKASDDIDDIAKALFDKKVATMFVLRGKSVPGSFDSTDGTVNFDTATDPTDDKLYDPASPDVVDSLLQAALKQDAQVFVLEPEQMPTDNYVAAIYRY